MGLREKLNVRQNIWRLRPEVLCGPTIPMPMSGVAPRVVLGQAWWDAEREAAKQSTNWHCVACGVFHREARLYPRLEGHELYTIDYEFGLMMYMETVPLCHYCHSFIHCGRLNMMLNQRKITPHLYNSIMKHGKGVLSDAGLTKPKDYNGPVAEWGDWRLVIVGDKPSDIPKEYPPLYKSLEEWHKAFDVTTEE